MQSFLAKHADKIAGVVSCFDRVIVRGHLPMAGPGYFSTWLYSKKIALNLQAPPEGWRNFKEVAPGGTVVFRGIEAACQGVGCGG